MNCYEHIRNINTSVSTNIGILYMFKQILSERFMIISGANAGRGVFWGLTPPQFLFEKTKINTTYPPPPPPLSEISVARFSYLGGGGGNRKNSPYPPPHPPHPPPPLSEISISAIYTFAGGGGGVVALLPPPPPPTERNIGRRDFQIFQNTLLGKILRTALDYIIQLFSNFIICVILWYCIG